MRLSIILCDYPLEDRKLNPAAHAFESGQKRFEEREEHKNQRFHHV